MSTLNRRQFVFRSAAAVATVRAAFGVAQTPAPTAPTLLTLHPDQAGPVIPRNFIGLSYETQQLSDPTFFSPQNQGLIEAFKALAPHGVLRLGGNTSDLGWWKAHEDAKAPTIHIDHVEPGFKVDTEQYAVTPEAIQNLHGFLEATGWSCLYGINLGTNTPQRAAEEAEFVARTLGHQLEYFQLGNEPDQYNMALRNHATWSADKYFDEWLAEARAILQVVPEAKFGLPDTAGNPDWYARVASRLLALPEAERPTVEALSHHYYFSGPPRNPEANIDRLLQHSRKVDKLAEDISSAASRLGVHHRMTEGNTCYLGGKPGLSDVFAATLWAADYALTLAHYGYAGINLHGGGGHQVAASLGGALPGEALMKDPSEPHPRPFYTPIAQINDKYVQEPVFFGLLFAQQFAGAHMIGVDLPTTLNVTSYAATLPNGDTLIAVINKSSSALQIHLPEAQAKSLRTAVLRADALTSTHVEWTGGSRFAEEHTGEDANTSLFTVPAISALMIRVKRTIEEK